MLDINLIRIKPDFVRASLKCRAMNSGLVDDFLSIDREWRELVGETDALRAKLNSLSRERNIDNAREVKTKIKLHEANLRTLEEKRDLLLNRFPNIPAADVPVGDDESGNIELSNWGKKPSHLAIDYLTLAETLDLIDVGRASKVTGTRFGYLKREAALFEFAIIRFAFDTLAEEGFIPIVPPVMIRPELFRGMGRLSDDQKDERYYLERDNLYLVGSAEHTIGSMHSGETFAESDLPRRYVGFSTCFRREAGSYGRDTRGIFRVHQFDKVEMFSFTKPEDSESEHRFLLSMQEKLMRALELPYRVVQICTGDLGFTDAKQFDIETWIPSEERYRETHSCSNTTDFQARGVNIRYKSDDPRIKSESRFVHMLNATTFAIGRTIIAIFENYQTERGTVKIPKALQKYMECVEIQK